VNEKMKGQRVHIQWMRSATFLVLACHFALRMDSGNRKNAGDTGIEEAFKKWRQS
jgi:hypothetical protein